MDKDVELVIADDNLFFAEALADNLNLKEGITVKKVFSDLLSLESYCDNNTFDILILDVNFKGNSSLEFLGAIRKNVSDFKIIILTSLNDSYTKSLADQHKVELFLSKDASSKNFNEVILDCYYSTLDRVDVNTKNVIEINGEKFTDTKIKVLKSLYKYAGKTEEEIARELNIAVSSLKTHKRQLYEMTNTKRITDLIKFGFDNGILLQK